MSEIDIDVGKKRRRLPLWMRGVTATDQVRKSSNKDADIPSLKFQPTFQDVQPKAMFEAKKLKKGVSLSKKEASKVNSSLLLKRETRKRVRKLRLQDKDGPIHSEDGLQKKRAKKRIDGVTRTIDETVGSKKCNQKSYELGRSEEIVAQSPNEENGELTVDDLMSIAEEYVKADNGEECQLVATTENKQPPATSGYCRNESGGSAEVDQIGKVLSTHTMEPTSNFTKTRLKDQESSASESIIINPSRTGDPTQDMLDLFLGPLLKKPQTGERKHEFVKEDITLDCDFRKQVQSEVLGEKVVPLTKKKSSLKDKVAMFL